MSFVNVNRPFPGAPTKGQMTEVTLDGIRSKQKDNAKYIHQTLSHQKYREFEDLSKDGLLKPYLENCKARSQNQLSQQTNKIIGQRLSATETQLNSILEQIEVSQRDFTTAQSAAKDTMNLSQIIEGRLSSLQSLLNQRVAGKAIFGGYDNNDDPVKDIVNISNIIDGKPTSNYASGSQEKISYDISSANTIKYNIVSSDEAFVKVIGSYHLALEGKITEAGTMMEEGRRLLSQRITEVGNNSRLIDDANSLLTTQELALNEEWDELFAADINEAATLSTATLDSMKNSQWVMSRILGSSLVDMLQNL